MGLWGFGMIGSGDRVKVTKRGAKGVGTIVTVQPENRTVTVKYDDGSQATVRDSDVQGTRK